MKIAKALICLTLIHTSILPAKKESVGRIEAIRQKVRTMLPTTARGGFKLGVATMALVSGVVILYLRGEFTRLKIDHGLLKDELVAMESELVTMVSEGAALQECLEQLEAMLKGEGSNK